MQLWSLIVLWLRLWPFLLFSILTPWMRHSIVSCLLPFLLALSNPHAYIITSTYISQNSAFADIKLYHCWSWSNTEPLNLHSLVFIPFFPFIHLLQAQLSSHCLFFPGAVFIILTRRNVYLLWYPTVLYVYFCLMLLLSTYAVYQSHLVHYSHSARQE